MRLKLAVRGILILINSRSQHDVSHPVSGTYSEYNLAYNPLHAKYYRTSKIFAIACGDFSCSPQFVKNGDGEPFSHLFSASITNCSRNLCFRAILSGLLSLGCM